MTFELRIDPTTDLRPGARRYSGTLVGPNWHADLVIDLKTGSYVNPALILANRPGVDPSGRLKKLHDAVVSGDVAGFWSSFSDVMSHPATLAIGAAISAIPGVGQVAAPLLVATKAVAMVGANIEAKDIAAADAKQMRAMTEKMARDANEKMRAARVPIATTAADFEKALKARALVNSKEPRIRIRVNQALLAPFRVGDERHKDALALKLATLSQAGHELTLALPATPPPAEGPADADPAVEGYDIERHCGCGCGGRTAGGCA